MSADSYFAQRCVAIDLEVSRETGCIHHFAAVRGDKSEEPFVYSGGDLRKALDALDAYASGVGFLMGHNLIAHDIPWLKAAAPGLQLLRLPVIDTLRLSPLAFPQNPYHRLVKHYKDGALLSLTRNDPELDARLSLQLFMEEEAAFRMLREQNPQLLNSWRWLVSHRAEDMGFACFFDSVSGQPHLSDAEGLATIRESVLDIACVTSTQAMLSATQENTWPLMFALAWLSVAGGNSVMPPWVRHEFPEAAHLVRHLRDLRPSDPSCKWCETHHNPKHVLKRWFGFHEFRPHPVCADGRSMQESIVEASMSGKHVLGILPTGTGKSLCYQVPALARYENTGALTIVISPLVALMADQVYGLQARGIESCAALNGQLSMPERSDVLERVRLGDIAMLLVSPEQLRNIGFRRAVAQREIGAWVLDEAHCLSKWGHDFRTDYRYVGRFIKESAGENPLPPVLCLTATAKPDVVDDICAYFLRMLGKELEVFDGGASRDNLDYGVAETTPTTKLSDIHSLLEHSLGDDQPGGAIIYCATRKHTEELARFLVGMGWSAAHFHAGLSPELKKQTQQQFIVGELRVIVATNAFGMGIDKPDVRLVIHAEIPGSLENYVQESGRAGRDQLDARCVLLYCEKDIEQQFGLSALSRLPHHEIQTVLRALRRMAGKRRPSDRYAEVVATSGEILDEDVEKQFVRDSNNDDTRVRTAISWLEEAQLARREENRYQVFPSSLKIPSVTDAEKRLAGVEMPFRGQLLRIVHLLMQADPTQGVTTDELMGAARLSRLGLVNALDTLEKLGVLANDMVFTALVHVGIADASKKRLESAVALETALIAALREAAPDLEKGASSVLHLRQLSHRLKSEGYAQALPERIYRLLQGIASDGRSSGQHAGSLRLRKIDAEMVWVTLQRDWEALQKTAELRKTAAQLLLAHLLSCIPPEVRGYDCLAETTMGNLQTAVESDLLLKDQIKEVSRLVECALLWLHEQEVMRLGKGLVVLRPAMTVHVAPGNASFTRRDYSELQEHYSEQVVQIHVMAEYARRGLQAAHDAIALATDYFRLDREEFIRRWFPQAVQQLSRQTTNESWDAIVKTLNPVQRDIVKDERERTNVLVLAGPGSGKTRVLVHRIAYLVRARRENPRGILALAYNRHAMGEIRRRLRDLIGDDANGVTVLTCHALAMRLVGASFANANVSETDFRQVLKDAAHLLQGDGLLPEDADERRERLLSGFRWILVDEYQDIDLEQYELIAALAGRTLHDPERRLSLFAVGDDDQNIYGFAGTSVAFIRRFQEDYRAKAEYLVENYRSTENIINASNALIGKAWDRMKKAHPIRIDEARRNASLGGLWEMRDPVARGRVQILTVAPNETSQAAMVMEELLRLAALDPEWDWSNVAIVAREWELLEPVLSFCMARDIPAQRADQNAPQFWRLRETQRFVAWLSERSAQFVAQEEVEDWFAMQANGPWLNLLREAAAHYRLECGDGPLPGGHFREWLAEWGREIRRRQRGLLLLTAHRVKGLEFDHVVILDGRWEKRDASEDPDAVRRLYYVAMTRARQTLTLAQMDGRNPFVNETATLPATFMRPAPSLTGEISDLEQRYVTLTPGDVDLSFAGRFSPAAPIHKAIARLQPGDPLQLVGKEKGWLLYSGQQPVGRLAKGFAMPPNMKCVEAQVYAVLVRFRSDSEPDYVNSVRCDQWEVVIAELVFVPEKDRNPQAIMKR